MSLLIAAIVAFVVALFTASAVVKARQGADTARIALLEQRVEELTHRLGSAPAPFTVPLAAPNLGPDLGPNLGPTQPVAAATGLPANSLSATVASLVARGKKIEAIKVYRDQTGVGLKEAKDAVERIERQGF